MRIWGAAAVLGAAVLVLPGCVNREAQAQAKRTQEFVSEPATVVETLAVQGQDLPAVIEVTGSIAARDKVSVGPVMPGRLVAVYVREGDMVSAGQLIAQQDTRDAMAQYRQAQAQVDAARSSLNQAIADSKAGPARVNASIRAAEARLAQAEQNLAKLRAGARDQEKAQADAAVNRAKSDLDSAKLNLDRMRNLYREGAIAKAELEVAENRYETALSAYESALEQRSLVREGARPEDIAIAQQEVNAAREALAAERANKALDPTYQQRIDAARANLRSAQEGVQLARKALDDLSIRSPFSGKVSGRPLQAGAVVSPGMVIAELVGADQTFFEAEIPEKDLTKVQIGATVTVTIDALQGAVVTGTVTAIDPLPSDVGRLYTLRVSINEALGNLQPGMFARGQLKTGTIEDVFLVPAEAIIRDGEKNYVFLMEGDKAVRVEVTTGPTEDGTTQVMGLTDGDQLIVKGQSGLIDGALVKLDDGGGEEPAPEPEEQAAGH